MKGSKMLGSREFWRRIILASSLVTSLFCYFGVSLQPLLSLTQVDFAHEQKHPIYPSFSDQDRTMPLDDYIARKTDGKLVEVKGDSWENLFQEILSGALSFRTYQEDYPPRFLSYFFYPPEMPEIDLPKANESIWVKFQSNENTTYWRLTNHTYSYDDFHLGVGLSRQDPPASFLYPLRRISLGVLVIGFLLYVFLPWPRHQPGDLFISRSRVVLSDFVAMTLFMLFLSLPLFVVGGTQPAIFEWWGFCALIWPLAMLGFLLVKYVTWYSSLLIRITAEGLSLRNALSDLEISFSYITSFAPALKGSSKWLVGAMGAGALVKGSIASAGQALIAAGAQACGYALNLKDGRRVFIWYSDNRGVPIMNGYEKIAESLTAAGVKEETEPVVSTSLGLEFIETPASAASSEQGVILENFLIILGPSMLLLILGFLFF